MPRVYKSPPGTKKFKKHSEQALTKAVHDVWKGMSYMKAAMKHNINYSVIRRHKIGAKEHGGQAVLASKVETELVLRIGQCSDWGYPINNCDSEIFSRSNEYKRETIQE